MQDYIEQRDGGYWLAGSRVSLDSVVTAFQRGATPESILRSFPAIGSLVKVYGALTFYLENQAAIEAWLREQDALAARLDTSPVPEAMAERLRAAREAANRQPA